MRLQNFFATHQVFSSVDLKEFLKAKGQSNPRTRQQLLAYHQAQGHIVKVRRGLYATVPLGADAEMFPVDPYLVASRMTSDAVLAYHTALEGHGVAHSVYEKLTYLTTARSVRIHVFRGMEFQAVQHPMTLRRLDAEQEEVTTIDRRGVGVRVTTLERTVVDVFDRLDVSGGYDEVWASLDGLPRLNASTVADYSLRLGHPTTTARVGFFLDHHRDVLNVDTIALDRLKAARPEHPARFDPDVREPVRLVTEWNLLVPRGFTGDTMSEHLA